MCRARAWRCPSQRQASVHTQSLAQNCSHGLTSLLLGDCGAWSPCQTSSPRAASPCPPQARDLGCVRAAPGLVWHPGQGPQLPGVPGKVAEVRFQVRMAWGAPGVPGEAVRALWRPSGVTSLRSAYHHQPPCVCPSPSTLPEAHRLLRAWHHNCLPTQRSTAQNDLNGLASHLLSQVASLQKNQHLPALQSHIT